MTPQRKAERFPSSPGIIRISACADVCKRFVAVPGWWLAARRHRGRSTRPASRTTPGDAADPLAELAQRFRSTRPEGPPGTAPHPDDVAGPVTRSLFLSERARQPARRRLISALIAGTISCRSPITACVALVTIGASGSELMARIAFALLQPAQCWIAPLMPHGM